MTDSFEFELISPAKKELAVRAMSLVANGVEGQFTLLAGHATFVTLLHDGPLSFILAGGEEEVWELRGAVLEMQDDRCVVLAQSIERQVN